MLNPGVVIFTGQRERLSKFYEAVAELPVVYTDADVTVLGSDKFELVIHSLPSEISMPEPPQPREDSYLKPFFPVPGLAKAREIAASFGGRLRPQSQEWSARGFRACEAIDPDGNVIQFREDLRDGNA